MVPLYGTVLFKVMKSSACDEGCVEQIDRLFADALGADAPVDEACGCELDDWELSPKGPGGNIAALAAALTETFGELADLGEYKASSCACSASASTASTTQRSRSEASSRAKSARRSDSKRARSYGAWGCFRYFAVGPPRRALSRHERYTGSPPLD